MTHRLSHDETLRWIADHRAWREARKTKPIWARPVEADEVGKEFQTADHIVERATADHWRCVGVAGERLAAYADEIMNRSRSIPGLVNLRTDLELDKPQIEVDIDRDRASDLGVSVRQIASALQILFGGLDLTTFKLEGETYTVIASCRGRSARRRVIFTESMSPSAGDRSAAGRAP